MIAPRFATIPRAGLFEDEHEATRGAVREFVEREIGPNVDEWERAGDFPIRDVFRAAGAMGLFGAKYDQAYGGSGPDLVADAVITEEVARCGSGGVAAALGAHKDLATLYLDEFGTKEQKDRFLVPALAGESIGAVAVTEPAAGSDVAGISTLAKKDVVGWRLSGSKTFITNGPVADFVVVAAKTAPEAGAKGISLFLVDAATPGFVARRIETVGWRTSHTGELAFDGCRLPEEALLGELNGGFLQIMECLEWERMVMALSACAGASATLDSAIRYGLDRRAFGRPVARFQVWRHRLADLATEIEAARALTYQALRKIVAGEVAEREVSMAKWLATELEWRVADEALQMHGGYGYMTEFPVQRAWRDARLGPIGGGTTEVMKDLVAGSYGL